jgi:hypothetical protein
LSEHQHDRPTQLLVDGVKQRTVVGLGEPLRLAPSATVDAGAIDQPRVVAGLGTQEARDRHPAGSRARHLHDRVALRWPQVRPLDGLRPGRLRLFKHSHAPRSAAILTCRRPAPADPPAAPTTANTKPRTIMIGPANPGETTP